MRISDWSSDVCSSDLLQPIGGPTAGGGIVDTRQRLERDRAAAQVVMLAAQAEDGRTDRTPGVEHEYPRSGIAPELQHQHGQQHRSEEHTSELQSLMRISYAVLCLKKKRSNISNKCNYTQKNTRHII